MSKAQSVRTVSPPSSPEMPTRPLQLRNSCDRCSKAKRRCCGSRPHCQRCVRARVSCSYSVVRKGGKARAPLSRSKSCTGSPVFRPQYSSFDPSSSFSASAATGLACRPEHAYLVSYINCVAGIVPLDDYALIATEYLKQEDNLCSVGSDMTDLQDESDRGPRATLLSALSCAAMALGCVALGASEGGSGGCNGNGSFTTAHIELMLRSNAHCQQALSMLMVSQQRQTFADDSSSALIFGDFEHKASVGSVSPRGCDGRVTPELEFGTFGDQDRRSSGTSLPNNGYSSNSAAGGASAVKLEGVGGAAAPYETEALLFIVHCQEFLYFSQTNDATGMAESIHSAVDVYLTAAGADGTAVLLSPASQQRLLPVLFLLLAEKRRRRSQLAIEPSTAPRADRLVAQLLPLAGVAPLHAQTSPSPSPDNPVTAAAAINPSGADVLHVATRLFFKGADPPPPQQPAQSWPRWWFAMALRRMQETGAGALLLCFAHGLLVEDVLAQQNATSSDMHAELRSASQAVQSVMVRCPASWIAFDVLQLAVAVTIATRDRAVYDGLAAAWQSAREHCIAPLRPLPPFDGLKAAVAACSNGGRGCQRLLQRLQSPGDHDADILRGLGNYLHEQRRAQGRY